MAKQIFSSEHAYIGVDAGQNVHVHLNGDCRSPDEWAERIRELEAELKNDAGDGFALGAQGEERRAAYKTLEALRDRLQQEAEIHAQEARTANSTINEIYQVVSGGTGEPGNWNGAGPVRELKARADALEAELREVDEALNAVTNCQAPTRAQRITDSIEHSNLSADAAVFDAEKAEQSVRSQCIYWMGFARLVAKHRDTLSREVEGLRERVSELQGNLAASKKIARRLSQ